ncbi:pilus assembly protein [Agrobacterium sp. SOY23]|uniref:TadE/TadG family type IV pilus assembly protein n=1 Tax=Agrobacterium sp. SOY23 TaxID=3014555 RepID=UPI001B03678B|nr:TadE/TadG family type IV pilus assembly protein [Agrobacterium sp. SOY23]MBO9655582.1 pilus assembly protein [Agrobacterium tumefaciens]MCZ4429167.1 pilus assembly protein [Agrobacterium sp. SOY23]
MRLARLKPLLEKFGLSRDGTAAIEFAILAIPYFLVVFAIIETFIALMAEQVVVNATETMARRLRTGQISSAISKEDFRKNFCNEVAVMITCADEIQKEQKLYIDLRSFTAFKDIPTAIPLKAVGEYYDLDTAQFGFKPGGPETINMLRVYYRWRVVADIIRPYLTKIRPADGSMPSHFLIVATDAFMNEKYITSGGS